MPYIEQLRRDQLEAYGYDGGPIPQPQTAGELNYCITTLIRVYMQDKVKNYALFNSVVGALESCKLEFYRRIVAPYENTKIEENGDVY